MKRKSIDSDSDRKKREARAAAISQQSIHEVPLTKSRFVSRDTITEAWGGIDDDAHIDNRRLTDAEYLMHLQKVGIIQETKDGEKVASGLTITNADYIRGLVNRSAANEEIQPEIIYEDPGKSIEEEELDQATSYVCESLYEELNEEFPDLTFSVSDYSRLVERLPDYEIPTLNRFIDTLVLQISVEMIRSEKRIEQLRRQSSKDLKAVVSDNQPAQKTQSEGVLRRPSSSGLHHTTVSKKRLRPIRTFKEDV